MKKSSTDLAISICRILLQDTAHTDADIADSIVNAKFLTDLKTANWTKVQVQLDGDALCFRDMKIAQLNTQANREEYLAEDDRWVFVKELLHSHDLSGCDRNIEILEDLLDA